MVWLSGCVDCAKAMYPMVVVVPSLAVKAPLAEVNKFPDGGNVAPLSVDLKTPEPEIEA